MDVVIKNETDGTRACNANSKAGNLGVVQNAVPAGRWLEILSRFVSNFFWHEAIRVRSVSVKNAHERLSVSLSVSGLSMQLLAK
jgi:hypothetical protein